MTKRIDQSGCQESLNRRASVYVGVFILTVSQPGDDFAGFARHLLH
ncbi:MAG TPA: hypothetical protein VFA04_24890 [Bryobacteraceae bacterium]|nr:hypothetical protein [Bryobacteraceae bacterium]